MLNDASSCMTIPILLVKHKNCWECASGKSGATYSPDSAPSLCSKHLSGTMFCSENDVKTIVKNWLNGQDVNSARSCNTSWFCVQINA
ncbi:hypothetical protein AVEN_269056-1 [Araneus ventricosus]|uniref:Uncharacterized protein n=1 Tax=Araneus ventricosus TaxID=182803 RepID=A0A4Y2JGD5_ARAVE|nr:hypothetical protein AVEN_269056-1 [Araneus ventricosus]